MPFGLHIKFGYGIVLLEILRNTLVFKSGETRSFVFLFRVINKTFRELPIIWVRMSVKEVKHEQSNGNSRRASAANYPRA